MVITATNFQVVMRMKLLRCVVILTKSNLNIPVATYDERTVFCFHEFFPILWALITFGYVKWYKYLSSDKSYCVKMWKTFFKTGTYKVYIRVHQFIELVFSARIW